MKRKILIGGVMFIAINLVQVNATFVLDLDVKLRLDLRLRNKAKEDFKGNNTVSFKESQNEIKMLEQQIADLDNRKGNRQGNKSVIPEGTYVYYYPQFR